MPIGGQPAVSPSQPELALPKTLSSGQCGMHILGAFIFAVLSAWFVPKGYNLVAVIVAEIYIIGVLGKGKMNHVLGILISERNLMSLSRFQITVWTILITSSYFTIFMERLVHQVPDPLLVEIDSALWALMGISAASAVFSPMIQSGKKNRKIDEPLKNQLVAKTAVAYDQTEKDVLQGMEGTLYSNPSYKDARFTDIFEGEEMQNHLYFDISKVQMFIFTAMTVIAYTVMVFAAITGSDPESLTSLPGLPEGLVTLIGISHGGYLTGKLVNHTKSTPE